MNDLFESTLRNVINKVTLNSLINNYALENVVVGKTLPNMKIDFDSYINDLNLQYLDPQDNRKYICGSIVNEDEFIFNKSIDEYFMEFFSSKIKQLFAFEIKTSPKYAEDFFPFNSSLKSYFQFIFYFFKEIALIEPLYSAYDLISPYRDYDTYLNSINNISKFVIAIKSKNLKQGACVDKYFKNIIEIPKYLKRLIKKANNHYLLANNDTSSLDYIVALISSFPFYKYENKKLFEIKAEYWRIKKLENVS